MKLLHLAPIAMILVTSTAVSGAPNTPKYIEQIASDYGIEVASLQPKTSDVWPWIVWRGDTPIKLRDQRALIVYLQNDPSSKFGIYQLSVDDFANHSIADFTNPVTQARLIASRLEPSAQTKTPALLNVGQPVTGNPYSDLINRFSLRHGLPPKLVAAVMIAESSFNPSAVSHKGAQGLMQVMPNTARYLGYEPEEMFDPEKAIEAGTRYLAEQLIEFRRVDLALAAYNAGPDAVRKYGNKVPPYAETQNYVSKILSRYRSSL